MILHSFVIKLQTLSQVMCLFFFGRDEFKAAASPNFLEFK